MGREGLAEDTLLQSVWQQAQALKAISIPSNTHRKKIEFENHVKLLWKISEKFPEMRTTREVDILASQLAKTPCLRDVDASVLREAARSIRGVTLPGRTQVFKEGDAAASFYVVVQGVLGVYKTNGTCGNIRRISTIGPMSCFGELALTAGRPRSATVIAILDCFLFELGKEHFARTLRDPISAAFVKGCDSMASFLPFANMPFTEKTELLFSMHLERFRPMEMLPIYDRSSPANASLYFIQSGNAAAFVDTRADSFAKRHGGPIPVNECALVEALGPGDVAGDWALAADDSFTHVVAMTVLTAYKIDKVSLMHRLAHLPAFQGFLQRSKERAMELRTHLKVAKQQSHLSISGGTCLAIGWDCEAPGSGCSITSTQARHRAEAITEARPAEGCPSGVAGGSQGSARVLRRPYQARPGTTVDISRRNPQQYPYNLPMIRRSQSKEGTLNKSGLSSSNGNSESSGMECEDSVTSGHVAPAQRPRFMPNRSAASQSAQRMPTKGFVAIQAFHHFSVAAGLNAHVIADHRHHLPQDAESCTASMAASGCTVHPMGVDYLPSLESSIQFRDSSRGQGSEPSVSLSLSAPSSCLTATLLSLQQRYRRTNDALKPAERHPRDANKTDPPVLHIKEPSSGSQATMQSPACKSGTPISTAPSLKHADMLSQSLQGTKQECPRKLIRKISGQ